MPALRINYLKSKRVGQENIYKESKVKSRKLKVKIMSSNLSKYILITLAYYDVLDYPMTSFEIWKYLTRMNSDESSPEEKISLTDVIKGLESDKLKRIVGKFNGFYFLRGRNHLVEQRIERNKIAERKLKIARRIAKILRFIPFVRMVAVTGRLAMKNTEKKSDLDFFIVLKNKKIFTGRILVTLFVHILGKRRYADKIEDRVCLNYFITNKSLEIKTKDLFSSSEYYFMFPLFGSKTWKKFRERNDWIKKYKINFSPYEISNSKLIGDNMAAKTIRKTGEKILSFDFIENEMRKWQLKRIDSDPRTHQPGSLVMADDKQLIFLPDPQGPKVYDKFRKKIDEIAILSQNLA